MSNQPPPQPFSGDTSPDTCTLCGIVLPYRGRLCGLHLARLLLIARLVDEGQISDWPEHHPRFQQGPMGGPLYETHRRRMCEARVVGVRRLGWREQINRILSDF